MFRTAILTVGEAGPAGDAPVRAVREVLAGGPFVEVDFARVDDEQALIRAKLRLWCDGGGVDLVLTCGGVGLGLRERTPEATLEVVEREVPGLAELMRREAGRVEPLAALTRGVAGVRRGTLVVNLPGGAAAAGAAFGAAAGLLPHALERIGAGADEPPPPGRGARA